MKNAIIAVGLIVSGAAILLDAAPVFAVIDIAGAIIAKMGYNQARPMRHGGKQF